MLKSLFVVLAFAGLVLPVTSQAQTQAAAVHGGAHTQTVPLIPIGKFSAYTNQIAAQCVEIVAPSANTNGLIIRNSVLIQYGAGVNVSTTLLAGPTPPTYPHILSASPTPHLLAQIYKSDGFPASSLNEPAQFLLPAGFGVYGCADAAGDVIISYDLL